MLSAFKIKVKVKISEGGGDEMNYRSLVAPCGMNCALCQAYQGKGLKCDGCGKESERISCGKCRIRLCTNKQQFCFECRQYPCERLKRLDRRYREKYHMSMLENLNMIREKGLDLFVRRQNELYRCEVCGKLKTVHQKYCLFCGNENRK